MRGLVASTELDMETAETDDMMVRENKFCPVDLTLKNVSLKRDELEFIASKCCVWFWMMDNLFVAVMALTLCLVNENSQFLRTSSAFNKVQKFLFSVCICSWQPRSKFNLRECTLYTRSHFAT